MAHRDLASRIHVRNAPESGQARTDVNDPRAEVAAALDVGPLQLGGVRKEGRTGLG
jgi:hypothetical protein